METRSATATRTLILCWLFLATTLPAAADPALNEALIKAASLGKTREVARLLARGADPNANGGAPLMSAAGRDHIAVVRLLLKQGVDPSAHDKFGNTALMAAASRGTVRIARLLLDAGADTTLNDVSHWGSALHGATRTGAGDGPGVVKLLLGRGADARVRDGQGQTPLMIAAGSGSDETIIALLAGSDVNARDHESNTPLHFAVAHYSNSREVMKILLDHGADPNIQNAEGATPLHLVAQSRFGVSTPPDPAQLLLDHGADPAIRCTKCTFHRGATALFLVACSGNGERAKILLDGGAEVDAVTDRGDTPLMCAARSGAFMLVEIVSLLVSHGADPNRRGEKGRTALHYAAEKGHSSRVKTLLARGADPRIRDDAGETALDAAMKSGDAAATALLNSHEPSPDPDLGLIHAAERGDLPRVLALLREGADVNYVSATKGSALSSATYWKHMDVVRHLMASGADPTLGKPPALIVAASNNDWDAYDLLFTKAGTDREFLSSLLTYMKDPARLRTLLSLGADPNRGDGRALHAAATRGCYPCAKLMLEAGADATRAFHYVTAHRNAVEAGHLRLARLIDRYLPRDRKAEDDILVAALKEVLQDSVPTTIRYKNGRPVPERILRRVADRIIPESEVERLASYRRFVVVTEPEWLTRDSAVVFVETGCTSWGCGTAGAAEVKRIRDAWSAEYMVWMVE